MMNNHKRLSNAEIASFCSQMALLFQAGIAPAEGLNIMSNDTRNKSGKALLAQLRDICRHGEAFHTVLAETKVFPDYVIHTIALGEESGNLDHCMAALAAYYEKEDNIAESVKSAVSYPFIMILMMLTVIFVLISKVMPIFNQVYVELGSEMTGFAASLLQLGKTLNHYSLVLLILFFLLFVCFLFVSKTRIGRRIVNNFFNTFPLTKGFYESVACGRFASGMALALSSGLDIFTGLDMVSHLVENKPMQDKITHCKKAIREGANLPEALATAGIFNHLYTQMIAIGTKSGNMDTVLHRIAANYEKSTDKRIQDFIAILEPTLVIILSVIVGLILLSVIMPLTGIMTSIG